MMVGTPNQERDFVLFRVFQAALGRKVAQNHDFAARIQRGAGAARVDAAAVEPRGHVHRAVGRTEREVHHYIMCGQHFVDIVDRHTLGAVGRTRSIKSRGLIIDVRCKVDRRIGFGLTGNIIRIAGMARGGGCIALVADHHDASRLVFAHLKCAAGKFTEFRIIDKGLGTAVVDHKRDFARTLPVVDRAGDCADLVRSQIAEYKFGRIEQGEHDHIVFAYPVCAQRVRQTVGLGVELGVSPAAAGERSCSAGRLPKRVTFRRKPFR